jgi:Leucine-rich repeat (LRR) protein
MMNTIDYHGSSLFKNEYSVLKKLEQLNHSTFGFTEKNGHVTSLELTFLQVKWLPTSIGNLTALTHLDLRSNKLTKLPESIGNLNKLTRLELGSNKITALPESIGNLIKLTHLDIGSNKITTLPESIGDLIKLTHLDLSHNILSVLPESIGKLNNLETLNLISNNILMLPESFGNLSCLKELRLDSNHLIALPESFGLLSSLKKLHLIKNHLIKLPASFGHLNSLKAVHLKHNPLGPYLLRNNANKIIKLYAKSIDDLTTQFITEEKSLSIHERQRLLWELTPPARTRLEIKLPPDHQFLEDIRIKFSVQVGTKMVIYLSKKERRDLYHKETGKQALWWGELTSRYLKWLKRKLVSDKGGEFDLHILL